MTENYNEIRIYTKLCRTLSLSAPKCKLCLLSLLPWLQLRIDLTLCSLHRIEQNICLVGTNVFPEFK